MKPTLLRSILKATRAGLAAQAAMSALALPEAPAARAGENPLFGYTHLLPSPYTLPAGTLVLGTDVGFGVTDFFQVGTNVVRDLYQIYNANAKLSVLDYPEFAAGLTLGYQTFNYKDFDSTNPDLRVTSWLPGIVGAFSLLDNLALFGGANLNFTQTDLNRSGLKETGLTRGASLGSDLSWAYNPKKNGVGNVLSAGVSYDLTYDLFGFGASHTWPGFKIGLHYYPAADRYKLQPIIAGGAVVNL